MATILDKDLIRESTIKIDGREIILTLTKSQEIKMKLKGMKSGEVTLSILELFEQLSGKNNVAAPEEKKALSVVRESKENKDVTISLYDLRSLNAISGLDLPTLTKFDGILAELIENIKSKKK